MQVLGTVHEIERREQDLAPDDADRIERSFVVAHEPALSDSRNGLEHRQVGRARVEAEHGEAGGDSPARNHDGPVATLAELGHFGAQLGHRRLDDVAALVGDRRGPDLHDDRSHQPGPISSAPPSVRPHQPGSQSNSKRPMRTRSPSLAPARVRARSTPRRFKRPCT